jgi:hypothetical protein
VTARQFKAHIAAVVRAYRGPTDDADVIYHPPDVLPAIFRTPQDSGYWPKRTMPNGKSQPTKPANRKCKKNQNR